MAITRTVIQIAMVETGQAVTEDTLYRVPIDAEVVGPWAMFRDPRYAGHYWNLTHVPTGLLIGWRAKKRNLRLLMAAMDALPVDWSAVTTYDQAKALAATLPEDIRKAVVRTALDFEVDDDGAERG